MSSDLLPNRAGAVGAWACCVTRLGSARIVNQQAIDINATTSRKSSIFLRRKVGAMFMRVNAKCAHQVRPPLRADSGGTQLSVNRVTARVGKSAAG